MTPEEQRIALAEWAGWKYSPAANSSIKHEAIMAWYRPGNSPWHLEQLPDYPNDINAVHELIHRLPSGLREVTFISKLAKVCGFDPQGENAWDRLHAGRFAVVNATATQRCEALLKTLNLWKP